MEDPALNRSIEETRELQTRWAQFNDFLKMAAKGDPSMATPEAESKFLELKTRIAMLHDGFMSHVKHDHKIAQQVLVIIGQCIMLRRVPGMSQAELQKIELDWNEAYLLMTETITNMEEERERLALVDPRAYQIQKAKEAALGVMHAVFMNLWFRLVFFMIVIPVFVAWGVPALGIYNWRRLKYDVPPTARLVLWVEKTFREKGFDVAFETMGDMAPQPMGDTEERESKPAYESQLGSESLQNNLVDIGFGEAEIGIADNIFRKRLEFRSEVQQIKRTRRLMLAFYILFETPADARRFVELRRKSIESWDAATQAKLANAVNVFQVQNFVGIAISEEPALREGYIAQKWGLAPEDMNK